MNAVDILIVIVASSAVAVGMHIGLMRQIGLSAGILMGCFVAALLQTLLGPLVVKAVGSEHEHFVFWLMLVATFLVVGLVTDFGLTFGQLLHKRWRLPKDRRMQWGYKITATLVAGIVALTGLWLLSVMFVRSPVQAIANSVGHSTILRSLSKRLPAAPTFFARASNLLNPHASPVVFFDSEPIIGKEIPGAQITPGARKAITERQKSVVRIAGRGCSGTVNGSGFVVADNLVMTNAHVVAGLAGPQISIIDNRGAHQALPIYFDPILDIAILRSAGLAGGPIPVEADGKSQTGVGATIGFATGNVAVNAVTITGRQSATGYDIYDRNVVTRDVYAFRGNIAKGDSGGPLLNANGQVVGIVFAKSPSHPDVGYALATNEITKGLVGALANDQPVGTGQCGAS